MKKKLEAKVKSDVKVYLIPRDQLKFDKDGRPILDDRYLVYKGGQNGSKTRT